MKKYPWYWSAKTHDRWAVTRAQGKRKFILVNGILAWGLPMFFIMALMPVISGKVIASVSYFALMVPLWTAAGFFFGWGAWAWSEKLFKGVEAQSGSWELLTPSPHTTHRAGPQ